MCGQTIETKDPPSPNLDDYPTNPRPSQLDVRQGYIEVSKSAGKSNSSMLESKERVQKLSKLTK